MKENSATLAAIPMQLYRLPPEALNGPKFALRTKNQPTTPTNSSGRNFSTTVTFWNQAICRTPARFTAAGTHRPSSAMPQFAMRQHPGADDAADHQPGRGGQAEPALLLTR